MSNVRVTYSGLIAFIVTFTGILTGTIFVIIVTRRLTLEEFGLWTLIGSLITYVTIIEPIITYWTTRQIARAEKVGKTALVTSGFFSIGGISVYVIIAIVVAQSLNVDFNILLLAGALIPLAFLNNILSSICIGFKPQSTSYGLLAFETTKIPLGFYFVVIAELGIIGAILTIVFANLIKMIILIIMAKEQLSGTILVETLKFWFKMSWLTLYKSIHGFIFKLDVMLFSLSTNSLVGLAYWGSASAVSNFVANSGSISQGLYPKLLATRKQEYAIENFKRTMYFAIPILAATIIFAKSGLHILNPLYGDASFIVIILAFRAFSALITGFCFGILESFEKVDLDKQASFKKYVKSKLFLVPTLRIIFSSLYVGVLALFLIAFGSSNTGDVETVTIWALIILFSSAPFSIYGLIKVKKSYGIIFPYKITAKYILVAIATMILITPLSDLILTYPESIWNFLPEIIPLVIFGVIFYFGVTYIIDESTRKLFKSIYNELLNKKK